MAYEIVMTKTLDEIMQMLEGDPLPEGWFTVRQYHDKRRENGVDLSLSSTQALLQRAAEEGKLGRSRRRIPPDYRMTLIYFPNPDKARDEE